MPPISKWDAVVREIQHETGLPDDAFRPTPSDKLRVMGSGRGGDVTRSEREGIYKVLERRSGLVGWMRDGTILIEPVENTPGSETRHRERRSDFDIGGGL